MFNLTEHDFNVKFFKSNLQYFLKLITQVPKNQILFVASNLRADDRYNLLISHLKQKQFNIFSKWPFGTITNFYQLHKNKKNAETCEILKYFKFTDLRYIIVKDIHTLPESTQKELLILQQHFEINIIVITDVEQFDKNKIIKPDVNLYYSKIEDSVYASETLLSYLLLSII